jgi:AI-2 transport protein TqsA
MAVSPRASDRRVQTVCLLTLTLIATGFAMAQLQPVLVPFVLALFLSQCLAPLILLLMRRFGLPRWLAVTVAVVLAGAALTGVGFVVASSMGGHDGGGAQFSIYKTRLDQLYTRLAASRLGQLLDLGGGGAQAFVSTTLIPYIPNGIGQLAGVSSHTATVLLLMAFLLFGRRWDDDPLLTGSRPGARGHLVAEVEARVQQYISVTVAISVLTGLLVGGALAVLNVQFAAVFGLLAGVLTFIPNFGGVIATLLPLPVVLLDPKLSIPYQVLAFAIPTGIQVLIGSFVQPKMTGQSLDLHPVVILLSLLFFTMIWGVGGAFLAVPLTATFKIVFEKMPNTRPLAAALAGDLSPLTDALEAPEVVTVALVENGDFSPRVGVRGVAHVREDGKREDVKT